MSKTSAAVKNRYNQQKYDRLFILCKKGQKEKIAAFAQNKNMSLNAYVLSLVEKDMGDKWTAALEKKEDTSNG